tara:strand:+ start:172 stop:609 length:438 start_codon:yes stop_codon:yes gene_type:complete
MKIALATDHAGFDLKEQIKKKLLKQNFEVKDFGAFDYDAVDDYPDFIMPAAKFVAKNSDYLGVILGGSGQGEAMAANRITGVRAAVFYNGPLDIVKLSRQHNNANILSIGARFLSLDEAMNVIDIWLKTDFEGDRHQRRINKLDQ